jgi:anaerobic selenocysteine-containing dehydrogenase
MILPMDAAVEKWVPTACRVCFSNCSIKVRVQNGVVTKIEGNSESPYNSSRLCPKANAGIMMLYDPNRVLRPLKRTNPEKGIGIDPKWVEISWEEALDIIEEKLKKIRREDPRKLVFLCSDHNLLQVLLLWFIAYGTPNHWMGGTGVSCGAGGHQASAIMHGGFVVVPDVDYCNYLIMLGTNFGFGAGYCGPEYYAKKFADARSRGMKTVVIDPVCSNAASKADEWVPILPGTDGMLALSIINVLLNELCIYDVEFLTKRSNAPYLVGPDGRFVRDPELKKPLVWDLATNTAKPYLDPEIREPALEGVFEVNNIKTTPSFQLFKEHVKKYTVEGASRITTIPAKTIRRLAKEFAEEAKIGSTVVIEGKKLPYRPACFFYWSGAQSD